MALATGVMLAGPARSDAWVDRFVHHPPAAAATQPATLDRAPAMPAFAVTPGAAGPQLVRVPLAFPAGALGEGIGVRALAAGKAEPAALRVLTWRPGLPRWVRRGIVSFVHDFAGVEPVEFALEPAMEAELGGAPSAHAVEEPLRIGATTLTAAGGALRVACGDGASWRATPIAPPLAQSVPAHIEIVERNAAFLWARIFHPDPAWPRIVEVRADALGTIILRLHVQRLEADGEYAPELGWTLDGLEPQRAVWGGGGGDLHADVFEHSFGEGAALSLEGAQHVTFPDAHLLKKGAVRVEGGGVRYRRSDGNDRVPMQRTAWRTATLIVSPPGVAPMGDRLEYAHRIALAGHADGPDAALAPWPYLGDLVRFHRDAIAAGSMLGDDFGNVGSMPVSGVYGMNRLNHAPAIFGEYARSGDARLRTTALRWCDNHYDLSIWWGEDRPGAFGGTRYNNRAAQGQGHAQDPDFMWRSNDAVHFCTKGYDAFLDAYEETGDPRMAVALHWQADYAARMVHTDQGECRNIGDAADFMHLYRATGMEPYRGEALRLFRELRTKLGPDHLFSQGGQPIVPDPPFIDNDDVGYRSPFAKPYIIGYALAGLPALAAELPAEPALHETIRAVAHFLAGSVDPAGGWRYPHPRSSSVIIGQGMEHAAQIARAARWLESRGEDIAPLVDAVETVLQGRLNGFLRSGQFLGGLQGWERSTGALGEGEDIHARYAKPTDRGTARDYAEGSIGTGALPPEGAVYFFEVLEFYLGRRPAERLLHANPQLAQVLGRMAPAPASAAGAAPHAAGVRDLLPEFAPARIARMKFPSMWDPARGESFEAWRARAREALVASFQTAPPRADFAPAIETVEDRGSYEARRIYFNISGDSRIPAYLLVPKAPGRHPAVLALHDHGAHFSIGKEKVVRPIGASGAVVGDAADWTAKYYGGQYIGDTLAARGFVVLAIDMLFWGERSEPGGSDYEHQQALAANLLQLGMSWSGVIAWDDMRSAEFLASLPEADPARIGAVGLSVGAHRTWTLCAASDRVQCGAAICWLGTTPMLMAPGNNQTRGQSAFSMLMPGLRNALDYAGVAAIACPKPMLFFNGTDDALFPVAGVEAAYADLRRVWESQSAGERLVTRLWPAPHEFNAAMQQEALGWLDTQLQP